MKALISPVQNNFVVQVEETPFEVADPLFWVDCSDDITPYNYTYNGSTFESYVPTITAQYNKGRATKLLYDTDWATVSDVADPALSNPYLTNQSEFFAYRSQLRAFIANPTEGIVSFPTKPTAQWSS
jgi:hypothetical protein